MPELAVVGDIGGSGSGNQSAAIADDLPPIVANGNCSNIAVAEAGYLGPVDPQSAKLNIEPPEKRFRCLVHRVCKDSS